jgi:hypothetical protein
MESIQLELEELKALLKPAKHSSNVIKLENLWRGADISDDDIQEAKRAIFKKFDKN